MSLWGWVSCFPCLCCSQSRTPGFPSQPCLALGLLFTHHVIPEAVFPKSRREGGPGRSWFWPLPCWDSPGPLCSPSPEKEAFKKRQKLQQDNGEETDENEVEEVSGHRAHSAGLSGCGAL